MKKTIAVLLSAAFLVTSFGCSSQKAKPTSQNGIQLSQTTKAEKLELITPPDPKGFKVDPQNYYASMVKGYFEQSIDMPDKSKRKMKVYVPADITPSQSIVIIAPPNGADSSTFLTESGWKAIADKEKIYLALLEPDNGKWKGKSEETDYIKAAFSLASKKTYYCVNNSAYYLVGYGEGADAVQYASMVMQSQLSGVAAFGVTDIDDSFLQDRSKTPSLEKEVMQKDVPVPMWIGAKEKTSAVSKSVDYWKKANNCTSPKLSNDFANEIYLPKPFTRTFEVNNQNVAKVLLTINSGSYYNTDFVSNVWYAFLSKTRRYAGTANGSLRAYETPTDLGCVKKELVVDGIKREWLEYVPKSIKKDQKVPLVVAMHGNAGSGAEFVGKSDWYKLAEERGFIVVFPTGSMSAGTTPTWPIEAKESPDTIKNINFIDAMVKDLKKNYSIDEGKVYATGHSAGSFMTAVVSITLPNVFTAAASTSAFNISPTAYSLPNANTKLDIPYLGMTGEFDTNVKTGSSLDTSKDIQDSMQYWVDRYKTNSIKDAYKYTSGNYVNWIFRNPAGVPMAQYVMVKNKVHATQPEEAYIFYDFMSQYTRDANGKIVYMGK
ncbi:MAG: hypothetical protein K0R31_1202 [Clostridiales bacterium]|nr:hypothetical protein [Clostridiales bacterium]